MFLRLHTINNFTANKFYFLYNFNTEEVEGVSRAEYDLIQEFGLEVKTKYLTYKVDRGYLICTFEGVLSFRETLVSDGNQIYYHRSLSTLAKDIYVVACSYRALTDRRLKLEWKNLNEQVSSLTSNTIQLPSLNKNFDLVSRSIANKVLTREQLEAYGSAISTYSLVDKLITSKPLVGYVQASHPHMHRELVEGTYTLKDSDVIFTDGVTLPAYTVMSYVPYRTLPEWRTLDTAYALADEAQSYQRYQVEKLRLGKVQYNKGYSTFLHGSAFIKIVESMVSDYYVVDNTTDKFLLDARSCKIFKRNAVDSYKELGNCMQLQNVAINSCLHDTLKGVDTLYTLGINHIEVTEQGYDIRVLSVIYKDDEPRYYELPLLCCGKPCNKCGDAYLYTMGMHEVIISKTMYENLICVGEGKRIQYDVK